MTTPEAVVENKQHIETEALLPPSLDGLVLPDKYGLKGGAARAVAAYTLFGEELKVRDIDLVALPSADMSLSDELAQKYMPRDFEHGDGVEHVSSLEDLLTNRDFTINEVAVVNGKVHITERARDALENKKIELADEIPGIKMKAKAQLFAARLEAQGFEVEVSEELEDMTYPDSFWCGLMLDRALEEGYDVGYVYSQRINALTNYGFDNPVDFAEWILGDPDLHNVTFDHVNALLDGTLEAPETAEFRRWAANADIGKRAMHGAHWIDDEGY